MNSKVLAGAYKSNITPPLGGCIAGAFNVVRSENILDELFVHALVIDDGSTEVAIISVDVCSINRRLVFDRILPEIEKFCGICKDNIMLAATHTHAGPVLYSTLPEVFGEPDPIYVEFFIKQVVTAVAMAKKHKKLVNIGVGKGINSNHVFNRRLKKPDGQIVMNWVEADFIQDCVPSGQVDDQLLVARMDDAQGKPIAMIVNYGNHNNAVGLGISADIAGQTRKMLEKVYGSEMVVIFLLGPCGNTNWINYKDPDRYNPELYKKFGIGLAGTVLEISSGLEYVDASSIRVAYKMLKIEERSYCDYDTFEDDTFGRGDGRIEFFEGYRADKKKYNKHTSEQHNVDIHAISIGDSFAIASNPAELFCEFGMEVKKKSPFKYTMVSELTNGECGYVPTREAFIQGGYEVRKVKEGSYLEVGAGDLIAHTSLELLEGLKHTDVSIVKGIICEE